MERLETPPGGWLQAIGGTAELLARVPAISAKVLEQWQLRGHVELRNPGSGRGRPAIRLAIDVLQLATFVELARIGVQLGHARLVWLIVHERVMLEHFGLPQPRVRADGVVLCADPAADRVIVRPFDAAGPLAALEDIRPAPDAFTVLRVAPLVKRIAGMVAPQ